MYPKCISIIIFILFGTLIFGQDFYGLNNHKYINVKNTSSNDNDWVEETILKRINNIKKFKIAQSNTNLNDIATINITIFSPNFVQFDIFSRRTPTDNSIFTYVSHEFKNEKDHIDDFINALNSIYTYNGFLSKNRFYKKILMDNVKTRLQTKELDDIEGIYNYYILKKDNSGNFIDVSNDKIWQKAIIKTDNNKYDILKFEEENPKKVTFKYAEIFKSEILGYKHKYFTNDKEENVTSDVVEFIDSNNFICVKQSKFGVFKFVFEKVYPLSTSNNIHKEPSSKWLGNGSGFFINNQGLIATNAHVVENANDIAIEINLQGKSETISAKLVCSDSKNDLAILKIDMEFLSLNIPYIIDERIGEVSESVFTLGFPMALNGMGKEIKYTEGVISSLTGLNKDLSTYQITTPIQGGNSGGPLFDSDNNVIGIISSKLVSTEIENVGYAIKAIYLSTLAKTAGLKLNHSKSIFFSSSKPKNVKLLDDYIVLVKVK